MSSLGDEIYYTIDQVEKLPKQFILDMSVGQVGIGIGIEIEILFPNLRYLVEILVHILVKCVENSLTLKFHHDHAPGS